MPHDIALDNDGNLFVADQVNHVIRRISTDNIVTTLAGAVGQEGCMDGQGSKARFNLPVRQTKN